MLPLAGVAKMPALVTVPGYQIERLLNWGSQGDVFLATDSSGNKVALKIVTGDRCDGDVHAVERLRREARLLGAIRSQHVVGVRGLLESEEWCCLVLEYLKGQTLDVAVRERGGLADATRTAMASTVVLAPESLAASASPVPGAMSPAVVPATMKTADHVAWVLDLLVQLARGVAELHAIRLVHRDLKPQNAMLVDGRVVLIDFGFARMDGVTTVTQAGTAIGTLAFMGPELFRNGLPTLRSDVYGLGAIAWFCLVGGPPIGTGVRNLAELGRRRRPPVIGRHNEAVPQCLAAVLTRALEPDPRDRHQDAGELLEDLLRCQRGEPVHVPFRWGRVWRHHRLLIVALAVAAAAVLLLGSVVFGFDAEHLAGRFLARVLQDPEGVVAEWQACDGPQRDKVAVELNRRLGNDVDKANAIAKHLNLGLLRVGGRANHAGVLLPTNGMLAPVPPPTEEFLPLDEPRCLLVRPGYAWFLLLSRDRLVWWGPDDPLCLQMLVKVTVPDGEVVERSLEVLRTDLPGKWLTRGVRVEAGNHSAGITRNEPTRMSVASPFVVDACEASGALVGRFRALMARQSQRRAELDAWLAHPNEPQAVADMLWSQWTGTAPAVAPDPMPARLTFWEGHRLATYFGCRLPALTEWIVASQNDGRVVGSVEQRRMPDGGAVEAIDAEPAWDRTSRGIKFANSNVAEWTLTSTGSRTAPQFAAMPHRLKMNGVFTWNPFLLPIDKSDPDDLHGVRLVRTVVGP